MRESFERERRGSSDTQQHFCGTDRLQLHFHFIFTVSQQQQHTSSAVKLNATESESVREWHPILPAAAASDAGYIPVLACQCSIFFLVCQSV